MSAGTVGLLKLGERLKDGLAAPNDAASFACARVRMRALGGSARLLKELQAAGFVDADGQLTTGTKPFNIFARVASGAMTQPGMEAENANLGDAALRFVVACNRPENDEHWESAEAEWVGKASMAERHRFLVPKDLSWQWFNVLTFGLDGDAASLDAAIKLVEALKTTALRYAAATEGWSADDIRLSCHCFPHNSVYSLHVHMLGGRKGPTFERLLFKNLPIADVLSVLRQELAQAQRQPTKSPRNKFR